MKLWMYEILQIEIIGKATKKIWRECSIVSRHIFTYFSFCCLIGIGFNQTTFLEGVSDQSRRPNPPLATEQSRELFLYNSFVFFCHLPLFLLHTSWVLRIFQARTFCRFAEMDVQLWRQTPRITDYYFWWNLSPRRNSFRADNSWHLPFYGGNWNKIPIPSDQMNFWTTVRNCIGVNGLTIHPDAPSWRPRILFSN